MANGWFQEPVEHGLAGRGISLGRRHSKKTNWKKFKNMKSAHQKKCIKAYKMGLMDDAIEQVYPKSDYLNNKSVIVKSGEYKGTVGRAKYNKKTDSYSVNYGFLKLSGVKVKELKEISEKERVNKLKKTKAGNLVIGFK